MFDTCLAILELGEIHISWCATGIVHFLEACGVLNSIIVALYDPMYIGAIRKEEQDLLFLHGNIFILKLMVDIQKCMKNGYLWKVDKAIALVPCVYEIVDTANEVSTLKTHEADAFLNNLKLDSNGNLLSDVTINVEKYTLLLNEDHKPTCEKKQD